MYHKANSFLEIHGLSTTLPSLSDAFKELSLCRMIELPLDYPNIKELINLSIEWQIREKTLHHTPTSISYEGQILTGLKLNFNGVIHYTIFYIPATIEGNATTLAGSIHYYDYMILPKAFSASTEFAMSSHVLDAHIRQITPRAIGLTTLAHINVISSTKL